MKSKICIVAFALVSSFTLVSSFNLYGQVRLNFPEAKLPEEVVFVATNDSVINAGLLFHPKKDSTKSIAVIWVHGWGVNFYSPGYVSIGRAFAEKGYTFISTNTRMHDLANVEGYKNGKRVRGGGYWGIASEQTNDISAWIDFVESKGFRKIILIGHSAGAAAVREYQAGKQDNRVVGLVLASGSVDPAPPVDSAQYIQALPLIAENKGDELIKDPKRSFPSYISAATLMDIANTPPEYKDFFGFQTPNAGITKIQCPVLAFYGTYDDVGNEKTLESLKKSIQKQPKGPVSVTTVMIKGAEHMYMGKEKQVAAIITEWIDDKLK